MSDKLLIVLPRRRPLDERMVQVVTPTIEVVGKMPPKEELEKTQHFLHVLVPKK